MGSPTDVAPTSAFPRRPNPPLDRWDDSPETSTALGQSAGPLPQAPIDCEGMPLAYRNLTSFPGNHEGFLGFDLSVFPQRTRLFEAHIVWHDEDEEESAICGLEPADGDAAEEEVRAQSVEVAAIAVRSFLERHDLAPKQINLLIASQYPPGFAASLAQALSIPAERVPHVPDSLAKSHAAGELAAFEAAITSGAFVQANLVLFVAVSPGITVRTALYRQTCPSDEDAPSTRCQQSH